MIRVLYFIILVFTAVYDAKTLEINDKFLTLIFGCEIIWTPTDIIEKNLPAAAAVWVLFAITVLISSLAGRDAPIGMGDIKLLSVLSIDLGGISTMMVFCAAGLLSGAYAAVLLLLKKTSKDSEIPFAPFIAAGYGVCMFAGF